MRRVPSSIARVPTALASCHTIASGKAARPSPPAFSKSPAPRPSNSYATRNRKNLVGTQVKAYAWQDEGIDKLLDNLQQKGNVNTAFAFTFLSEPTDASGRIPLPDHGTYSKANPEIGGAFYDYDQKYFQNTTLR